MNECLPKCGFRLQARLASAKLPSFSGYSYVSMNLTIKQCSQKEQKNPSFILDAVHTPPCVCALAAGVRTLYPDPCKSCRVSEYPHQLVAQAALVGQRRLGTPRLECTHLARHNVLGDGDIPVRDVEGRAVLRLFQHAIHSLHMGRASTRSFCAQAPLLRLQCSNQKSCVKPLLS